MPHFSAQTYQLSSDICVCRCVFDIVLFVSYMLTQVVATATMFNVLYAIFEFFMPRVETRYQRRKQAMAMGTVVHFNHGVYCPTVQYGQLER
jgi:hypothetical protein